MKEQPDSQWLEELLKEEEPYLDNDGFSKEVVEALPKKKRWSWKAKRRLVKATVILASGAAALFALSGLGVDPGQLEGVNPIAVMTVSVVGIAVAIAGACLWVVTDRV